MTDQPGIVSFVTRHYKARTAVLVVLLGVAGVLEGMGVAAVLPILESMVAGGGEQSDISRAVAAVLGTVGLEPTLPVLLTTLVVLFTLKAAFLYVAFLQVGFIIARMAMELRLRLLRAVTWSRWRHVLSYPSGFIANAVSSEAGQSALAYNAFAQVLAAGMQVVAYLAVAFAISWQAASASLVAGVLIIVVMQGRVDASRAAGKDQVQIIRSILARLTDALPSLKPLKAMGMEAYLLPRLEEATEEHFQARKREIASTELLKKSREPLLMLSLAVGIWAIVTFTDVTTTSLMVLALLFYRTAMSITNMQHFWVTVAVGENSFHSLMEHINAAESAREEWDESEDAASPDFHRELRLEDVSFSYDGKQKVLDGLDATLTAGTFAILVGPSGSGKTTLTDLVTGLLRPTEGRVAVDGTDLARVNMRTWRSRIGYVPQNPMLFDDTVRDNITLGAEDVSDDQVVRALEAASAWEFVKRLPAGLDQRIGEGGGSLSGGQQQRLAIARALVRGPSLLILDEPTTALDAASEAEVCRAIESLQGSLTILAISHQPALRRLVDEVWEMEEGRVTVRPRERGGAATPAEADVSGR